MALKHNHIEKEFLKTLDSILRTNCRKSVKKSRKRIAKSVKKSRKRFVKKSRKKSRKRTSRRKNIDNGAQYATEPEFYTATKAMIRKQLPRAFMDDPADPDHPAENKFFINENKFIIIITKIRELFHVEICYYNTGSIDDVVSGKTVGILKNGLIDIDDNKMTNFIDNFVARMRR
jgi:hypothetical protein